MRDNFDKCVQYPGYVYIGVCVSQTEVRENQQSGDGSCTAVIAIIASICALAVLVAFAFMRRLCNRKMTVLDQPSHMTTVTAKQVDANFRITSGRDSSSNESSPAALRDASVAP